ncbi:MAG TPA: prepilin peptidase [Dermatophilaceae bacterium]|nr:prepilin peptidase [Dermatophilaceae bacterium]
MTWADSPGTPGWFVLLAVGVGALTGRLLQLRLDGGGYRLDDETGSLPRRPTLRLTLLTAFVWGLLAWRLGPLSEWALLPAYLALGVVGVALAWIDADVHRLPLGLTRPAYALLLAQLALASGASGDWAALWRALIAGATTWVVYYLLAWLAALLRSGFGYGDVQLAGLIGLATGYLSAWGPVIATYAAFILSGVYAVARLVTRRGTRKDDIPFGPWMLLGSLVALLVEVRPLF